MNKGTLGEYYTYKCLKPLTGYKKFIFNCYLPKSDGTTTEVDVILLHESGIYVLESKNYSGWIFGSEIQKQWIQTLPTGRGRSQKNFFLNPIIQNTVHIKWLRKYTDIQKTLPFYSYIVFSDRCTLKKITLTSGNHCVINRCNILSKIRTNALTVGAQLSTAEIDALYEKLYPLTQTCETQRLAHIENIHQKHSTSEHKEMLTNTPKKLCPRCGGGLVVRTATRGNRAGEKFLGCSHYPKCRFTQNI